MSGRLRLEATLAAEPEPPAPSGTRPLRPATDAEDLARLMLDAYRGSVDDDGETIDDARAEIASLLADEYGPLDLDASEVVERDGVLVAATLVTRWEAAPFLAFSMTAPAAKRQGLARAGLQRAMARLAARGEHRLSLVVTAANHPAVGLYRSLGFGVPR